MGVLQVSVMCYCVFVVCLVIFDRQKYVVFYIVHILINIISLNVK